jgi:hypothetical protein
VPDVLADSQRWFSGKLKISFGGAAFRTHPAGSEPPRSELLPREGRTPHRRAVRGYELKKGKKGVLLDEVLDAECGFDRTLP